MEDFDFLLAEENFAQLATVNQRGDQHIDTVWFERDGDTLLVATTAATQKAKNLKHNPSAYVVITNRHNPYEQVQIKARLQSVSEDDSMHVCDRIARRYTGRPFVQRQHKGRVVLRLQMLSHKYHKAKV